MTKGALGWIILAVSVTVVVGGGYYVYEHTDRETVVPVVVPAPALERANDELTRKRIEGIGSIDRLRPVPIAPYQDNAPGNKR